MSKEPKSQGTKSQGHCLKKGKIVLLRACAVFAVVLEAWGSPLLAQGCAMCKTSIAAQAENIVRSINLGIVILLVPPLLIMSTILYAAFRERD